MSESEKLDDISKMAENLNLTSSQEDQLLGMGVDGSDTEAMEVTVVDRGDPLDGLTDVDTLGVTTDVTLKEGTKGDVETTAEPASSEGQGASGGTTDPEGPSKRTRNRRRQRLQRVHKRAEERAAATQEQLLPLLTPKRGREVDSTPPSGGRGAKKVHATGSDLGVARKGSRGPLRAPKPGATVPVAQSTPSKLVRSAPNQIGTVPEQGGSADSGANAPEPCVLVPPTEPTNTVVDTQTPSMSTRGGLLLRSGPLLRQKGSRGPEHGHCRHESQ